jgi:hypothetical protein
LASPSFYTWRRVLERRAAEQPAFVPVQVIANASPAQASALEVLSVDGRTVRIAPGFNSATCGVCWRFWRAGGHAKLPSGGAH